MSNFCSMRMWKRGERGTCKDQCCQPKTRLELSSWANYLTCNRTAGSPSVKYWSHLPKLFVQTVGWWVEASRTVPGTQQTCPEWNNDYFYSHCTWFCWKGEHCKCSCRQKISLCLSKAHPAQLPLLQCEVVSTVEGYLPADPENGACAQAGRASQVCSARQHISVLSWLALRARTSRCLVFRDERAGWGLICSFLMCGVKCNNGKGCAVGKPRKWRSLVCFLLKNRASKTSSLSLHP